MKPVTKEVLKSVANSLMFDMTDEQYDRLVLDFEELIKRMKNIGEIEGVDEVAPMIFPYEISSGSLRDDVASTPLKQSDVLRNAKDVKDGQICLPKVIK